ncbi:type III secretion system chaperone [Lampropedia aestuarii]|uniref:type III secretion system chaperone n=1 Tax=Lampropedia aestuarii TaxID=2562762 RepID=UPI0024698BA9|nr:type III secretion system chaperone [Lampropedia aestuarii]MDH5857321.1 type III secretion system chaperone [Lampropedia aestuarii]
MSADQLLQEASQKLGCTLAFNYAGVASLRVDAEHQIDLEKQEGSNNLLIIGVIGALPAKQSAMYLTELLAANLFGVQTQGFQPALDSVRQELLLWQSFSDTENVAEFVQRLEILAQLLEHWKQRLAAQPGAQMPAASTALAQAASELRIESMLRV